MPYWKYLLFFIDFSNSPHNRRTDIWALTFYMQSQITRSLVIWLHHIKWNIHNEEGAESTPFLPFIWRIIKRASRGRVKEKMKEFVFHDANRNIVGNIYLEITCPIILYVRESIVMKNQQNMNTVDSANPTAFQIDQVLPAYHLSSFFTETEYWMRHPWR